MGFATQALATAVEVTAPDGSMVRILAAASGGSMAHFTLPAWGVSRAVVHRSVDELWFVVSGQGRMWRRDANCEKVVALHAGVSLAIPRETSFQFRSDSAEPLCAVGVTMPPWPGEDEAHLVEGPWETTA